METEKNSTIYCYIRTSTAQQEPDLQIADIISMIPQGEQYEVLKEKKSAWKDNIKREAFGYLEHLIRNRKVKHLYVWDLDRLHRNYKRLTEFFIFCKNYDCVIHSFNQKWLDEFNSIPPPWNEILRDMLIKVFGYVGQEESEKKSGRVTNSIVRMEGEATKSYKGNRWGRKPFPPQTITRVMDLHRQGKSVRRISKEVVVYDKNRNPRPISKSAVHKIITPKSQ